MSLSTARIPGQEILLQKMAKALVSVVLALFATVSLAATEPRIGSVLLAKGDVEARSAGGTNTALSKGSDVFRGDTVVTGSTGFVVLKMIDDTKLTLRPDSEIALNEFNDRAGEENVAIELVQGGLRAITGAIAKKKPEAFEFTSQTTTIGIRGTDFMMRLCAPERANQCGNRCVAEEVQLGAFPRQAGKPMSINGVSGASLVSECEPLKEIEQGVYVALFEGKLNVENRGNELGIESMIAARVTESDPECLIDLPNFLALDPFLTQDPDSVINAL